MEYVFTWDNTPAEIMLGERFHISTGFHSDQRYIIEQVVQGKRLLAIQRTGWGKSLCYQMASLYFPWLTIVFSPLKALMRDQCQRCNNSYEIPAAIVSSDFTEEENILTLHKAVENQIKILFIAPERLGNFNWQEHVTHMRISMVVVDEAHCISTWGHDFRPDYRRITNLLIALPKNTPVLAITATANQRVEEDILQQVGEETKVIRGTMKRPNLRLQVASLNGDTEKLSYLALLLPQLPGTGIIYTATRNHAEIVAAFLRHQGIDAQYYHAGCDDVYRQEIEQGLINNRYKVICSTNALGMGIDKPDLRFVIHYHFPVSPIHYYQEIGRAGRDGEDAYCILLYDSNDRKIQEYFILTARPAGQYYMEALLAIQEALGSIRENEILQRTRIASRGMLRTIVADLQEQNFIEKGPRGFYALPNFSTLDLASYDAVTQQKQRELREMENYATLDGCFMDFLASYLGDVPGDACNTCYYCAADTFPRVIQSESMSQRATEFLEEDFLPIIKASGSLYAKHETGWSLSYHGSSRIGKLVRRSKYEGGGPFAEELVQRAIRVILERYPTAIISVIVSVPPTKSGNLVEQFARSIADALTISYLPIVEKVRITREQKDFVNKVQKEKNVKDVFSLSSPQLIANQTILLIDDIYDSGCTLRAITKVLLQAGALAIYPFTITRTLHSDDQ